LCVVRVLFLGVFALVMAAVALKEEEEEKQHANALV